jgi:Protein of unknown function (DUF2785)
LPSTPEQHARVAIDRLLAAVDWPVCRVPDVSIRGAHRVVMTAILLLAAQLNSLALADVPATVDPATAGRDRSFWLALTQDCTVPADQTAAELVREAIGLLGSPDPTWRDDVGYGVIVSCVYQKRLLDAGQRLEIIDTLRGNLRRGIGEAGTDTVLLRSFSALDLSILVALELQDPVLDDSGYRRLLDDALAYLAAERDLRGIDPRVGWIHATAHTADLLKFLARDPRFTPADQVRLLDAAWLRMTAPETPVFTHAEDERLAAALLSVTRRPDFDPVSLEPWLDRFVALEKRVWQQSPPEAAALDAAQNARNLLRSLHLLLALPKPDPTPGQLLAREKMLVTLQQIRR